MAFNFVDTYFVGQLGTLYIAAISFTFPVVMVIAGVSVGIGASTAISKAIGEGDQNKMKRLKI